MRILLVIQLLCILSISLAAQDKKIAMLEPIPVSEGVSGMIKNMVRGELTKSLSREPGFSAFTRVDIDQVMTEFNFQESGMVNDEQRKRLGQMSGADYVCISKISKEENAYYIEASLVDIESGEIHNPGTAFAEGGIKNVNLACQQVAADMVGKKVAVHEKATTREPIKESATTSSQPEKNVDNPHNLVILEVEVNFKSHKFMVCDKDFSEQMKLAEAKKASYNLNYKGYNDWRLPTKAEAEVIQNNLIKLDYMGEENVAHWTSTPEGHYDIHFVWYPRQTFRFDAYYARALCSVRCVRDY